MDNHAEETRITEEARAEACACHDIYADMVEGHQFDADEIWPITLDLITHPDLLQDQTFDQAYEG